jgi:DNA helicase IV
VIDWRAPVSRAFYRAGPRRRLGVWRRRRFGVDAGQITAYEDENLLTEDPDHPAASVILAREIERPRVGPMRDIVATIQPEQDDIVRSDLAVSVCVQGAPGTGKTAVGLHRAAWLLYAHRERLARSGVLVVGPNASFLDHVSAVLPALGEVDVRHSTVEDLVGAFPVRGTEPVEVARLKGDARMAPLLARAVWSSLRPVTEPLVVPRGAHRWRVSTRAAGAIVDELRARGVRYGAARAMLHHRLAHAVLVQMENAGDSPDDRVQDAVARSREVKAYANAVWPLLTPTRLLFELFTDADRLAAAADGLLSEGEQRLLHWPDPPRTAGSARWTRADAVLLGEIADLLERSPSLGHLVLDEAQDLSAMQLRAVAHRCSAGSMTVLGDLAQGTTPWATPSWEDTLRHLGKPDAELQVLDRGFRVPATVIDFAARLLPSIAPGLGAPVSLRDDPGSLQLTEVAEPELVAAVLAATAEALGQQGSVGVIAPAALFGRLRQALEQAGTEHAVLGGTVAHTLDSDAEPVLPPRLSLVPATVAKGLEYDHVVVVEPATIAAEEADERTGLRRLYVVLTRAVTGLAVVHSRPLPSQLRR